MKQYFLVLCCLLLTNSLFAQSDLYMPLNVQKAYNNGSRMPDGTVGKKYFVNQTDYSIQVSFDPLTSQIQGTETITLHNNSADTLSQLLFNLFQNFYQNTNSRDFSLRDARDLHDGVKITRLEVNGESINLSDEKKANHAGTNFWVTPTKKIEPKTKNTIVLEWNNPMPRYNAIRYGKYDSLAYHVAYWFPRIAVYDDINGWNDIHFQANEEFYNEFGNFEVAITVPAGFVVWATGMLQNPEQVLQPDVLTRYKKALTATQVVNIVTADDLKKGNITTNNAQNTWKYKADYVPDFAFSLSNCYLWDGTSTEVDANTKRRVYVEAAYKAKSDDFYKVCQLSATVIEELSKKHIGVAFPYPKLTAFNGAGGMEFPMMVNDGSTQKWASTVHLTVHEITHTYFPFYMGINEQRYAWMDEGFANFLPADLELQLDSATSPYIYNIDAYQQYAGSNNEQALMTPSYYLIQRSYRNNSYTKPTAALYTLRNYLGKPMFQQALQEYMKRWNGKHPTPYDFFNTFNQVTGQNLNWFWQSWFFQSGYPDLQIMGATVGNKNDVTVEIQRKGEVFLPIELTFVFDDGTKTVFSKPVSIWKDGSKRYTYNSQFSKKIVEIRLGNELIPDINLSDNVWNIKK